MSDRVIFQMWGPFRQRLILNHEFYVEQAKKRLLSQFEDISEEADKFAEEWLSKAGQGFNPDYHDPSDFYEQANDESITFYELLNDMRDRTRLSVIAGMYHEWDKQLRDWLSIELGKSFSGEKTKDAIWKATFVDIFDLLECFGWQVRAQLYFTQLDACRIVVNVYKHGLGNSFSELKRDHPQFLEDGFGDTLSADVRSKYLDHTHLKVTDAHIAVFSDAIIAFWNDLPENVFQSSITRKPNWLSKAMDKDLKERETKENA